jgi:V8-like Glu-specific endopeptidase
MAAGPYGGGIVSHTYDTTIQYSSRPVQYYKEVDGGLTTYSTPPQTPKKAWSESALMYGRNPQELETVLKKIIPGKDGRVRISNTKDLLFCIHAHLTMVFPGGEYGGSGVIVGPHHVLTCGHNVYGGDPKKSWATSISVYPALNGKSAPFGEVSVVKVYTFADWTNKEDTNFDLALLVLNRSIGKYTGWGGVMSTPDSTLTSQRVHITGYPGDKNFNEMWTMEHIMKSLLIERFEYEIDTYKGQSGSAIWFKKFGLPIIVGIHTSGTTVINWGTRISDRKFTEFVIHLIYETRKINKTAENSQRAPAPLPKALPEKVDLAPQPTPSLIPQSVNVKEWANPGSLNLPPYSQTLKDFLAGNCTVWPGKKRAETHIVVPLFPQITLSNGTKVPFTLDALNTLDKAAGGVGIYSLPNRDVIDGVTLEKESRYAVMTIAPLPATRGILDPSQIVINAGYQMPRIIEAATAILWENRRSNKRLLSDTLTLCSDSFRNYPVTLVGKPATGSFALGRFKEGGPHLIIMTAAGPSVGSVGWRKF